MRPTHERVLEALAYDPETGVFTRRTPAGRLRVGDVAGTTRVDGYRAIKIDGCLIGSHVLAWLWMTGEWPTYEVDHIDGNPLNNAFANLRDEPHNVNMRNIMAPQKNSSSGFRGVSWAKRERKWRADIKVNGKKKYLGYFDTPEEASAAYLRAKAEHHGIETYQGRGG